MVKGDQPTESFIPDLCHSRAVFTIIFLAEVLALILCLGPGTSLDALPSQLAFTSLLVQWIALVSAALLCNLRGYFSRLGDLRGGLLAFFILQLVTLVFTYITFLVLPTNYLPTQDESTLIGRNLLLSGLISAVLLRFFYLQHRIWQNIRDENLAHIQSLQARIRPHFLFNSLNTVANLVTTLPEVAEEAILNLADLFRASLAEGKLLVPLGEEIELCEKYLHIEQQRLGTRLEVIWDIDELPRTVAVPPLLMQPLIENAIYHGIETLSEGGRITISGKIVPGAVQISITNPVLNNQKQTRSQGNQIALDNVRQRLSRHFGQRGKCETHPSDQDYRVTLTFPDEGSRNENTNS